MFKYSIILALLAVVFAFLVSTTISLQSDHPCSDPLACYLSNLEFNLPDISVDIDGTTLTLTDTVCHGVDLTSLPSAYDQATSLFVGIDGLGTLCSGKYQYGKLMKGTVTIDISRTNASMTVYVAKEGEFPTHVSLSACSLDSISIDIGFSSPGLEFLAPILSKAIEELLNKVLCSGIDHLLQYNVSALIVNTIDPKLQQIVSSVPDPYPIYGAHYLNWNDSIVSKIHDAAIRIQGLSDLPDFLRCMAGVEEEKGLSAALSSAGFTKAKTYPDAPTYQKYFKNIFDSQKIDLSNWDKNVIYTSKAGSIQMLDITISGFDTMNQFEILEPLPESKVTLRTALGLDQLQLDITLLLTINGVDVNGDPAVYTEKTVLSVGVGNAAFVADLVLAVDEHLLNSYYLDQLGTLPCWLSTIAEVSFPNLDLDLSSAFLSVTQIDGDAGLLERDLIVLTNNLFSLLLSDTGFGPLTTDTIRGIFQGPVRVALNERFATGLTEAKASKPCLSHYPYDDVVDLINWPESGAISMIDSLVNDMFGYEGINKLFSCATDGTGAFNIYTKRLTITLSGLTSFYGLSIFTPTNQNPYQLDTSIAAGYCPSPDQCNPLKIGVESISQEYIEELLGGPNTLSSAVYKAVEGVSMWMTFQNFQLNIETLTKLDFNVLRDLQHSQMGVSGCYASSLDTLRFNFLDLGVGTAELVVKNGANSREITYGINQLLAFITRNQTIESKNSDIATSLSNAPAVCAAGGVQPDSNDDLNNNSSGDNNDLDWAWQMFILIVGCVASLIALLAAYNYWGREKRILCGLEPEKADMEAIHDGRTFWEKYDFDNALVFRHEIPLWLKVSMPIAICTAIGLFANSNATPDAVRVMVKLHAGEKTIDVGSIFEFGLGSTVHDMWAAEVYFLAIIIAFFSGAWPYIKLMMMMFAWFAPAKLLSIPRRETFLIVLDALGKWSLVDFFVMILFLCAFYIQLAVGKNILVDVTVRPNWGFYGFLLATMISLGLSHIILACHRLVVETKVLPIPDALDPRESLSSIVYEIKLHKDDPRPGPAASGENASETDPLVEGQANAAEHKPSNRMQKLMCVKFTYFGKAVVGLMVLATGFFVVAGTFLITVGFEFKGLTGLMLGDDANVEYSYVSMGNEIPEHSGIPDDFGVRWMQAAFFLFGLAMPLGLVFVLMILWVVPLTISMQRTLYVLSEVLNAWSALDVYCLAIAASLLEIQQFAMFIVGDSCDQINKLLEKYFDEKLDGDDKCFDVIAYLMTSSAWLFTAAALLIIVGVTMLRICHHAIHQRLENTKKTVLETVRRHSRSVSFKIEENIEVAVAEEGSDPIVEKALVEPLVDEPVKHGDGEAEHQEEAEAKPETFWSKFTWRRFNFACLSAVESMGLVSVYYKEERASPENSRHSASLLGAFAPMSAPALVGRQD